MCTARVNVAWVAGADSASSKQSCVFNSPVKYMLPRIGLALVLCFAFPCLVLGADILMDPNDDACTASPSASPCATLAHAVHIAADGDRIILNTKPEEAVYNSSSTWQNAGSKRVTIESGSGPVRFKLSTTWIDLFGDEPSLTVLGSSTCPIILETIHSDVMLPSSVKAGPGTNITMRFVELRGLWCSSVVKSTGDFVTITNCTWFRNIANRALEVTTTKLTQIESCSFVENRITGIYEIKGAASLRFNNFSSNTNLYYVLWVDTSDQHVTLDGNSFLNNLALYANLLTTLRQGSVLTMTNNVVSNSAGLVSSPLHIIANESSIISIAGSTFTDNYGHNGVITFQGSDRSVLEIRTSTCTNNRGENGAGVVYLELSSLASALLSDNTFLGNTGTQTGAIWADNGNATMIRNVFQANNATDNNGNGGAIYARGCGLSVTDSKFLFNSAKSGGAVYMSNTTSPSSINNCEFSHNTASGVGGAMYFSQSTQGVVIENSSFRFNSAANQGGALHLNLNNQVNLVRNNSFESNWAQSFGGAVYCTSFGESPTLAILENEFTNNVAGGAGSTTTFGAAYYTTTCLCATDSTGLSTFTTSSQLIAIEEGQVDTSCPIFVLSPHVTPTADEPVAEQPTEEPEEPPVALGVVDPPPAPGGINLGVGAIVGIVVGAIALLLLLLLLILLILFYRRRRAAQNNKKNGIDTGAAPTTPAVAVPMSATVPLATEESASSESVGGESSSSLPEIGEDDVPAPLVVAAVAPVPVVASAAVQKRIREFGDDDPNIRVLRSIVAVIEDPNLAAEAQHSQLGELSEQLILRSDMLVARKPTKKQLLHDANKEATKHKHTNTINPRIIAKMDFSKMSHDGEIHDIYALLKALPDAATEQDAYSTATKKIRNRARAVVVAYEDRIPSEVDVRQGNDVEGDDDSDNDDELEEEKEEVEGGDDENNNDEGEDEDNGEDEGEEEGETAP